ncbi:hypothetical protein Sjap_025785 [Stephania japonica]|uniref:Uncharacterized protein n=1 Tax=Stephania japonica TaxID=461633 RepID=A0AAP0EA64_9MAGN
MKLGLSPWREREGRGVAIKNEGDQTRAFAMRGRALFARRRGFVERKREHYQHQFSFSADVDGTDYGLRCKFLSLELPLDHSFGLEDYKSDKSKCQEQFDVYKECKKKEVIFGRTCVLSRIA